MLARASAEERWKCVNRVLHRGEALSPATLYEIGGVYFVLYGHQSVRLQPDARKRVDQP